MLAAPAIACPVGQSCVDHETRVQLRLDALHKPDDRDLVELPAFWQLLRKEVYGRLPRYERHRFDLVLAPVVVRSPSDTVPGVGVEGDF